MKPVSDTMRSDIYDGKWYISCARSHVHLRHAIIIKSICSRSFAVCSRLLCKSINIPSATIGDDVAAAAVAPQYHLESCSRWNSRCGNSSKPYPMVTHFFRNFISRLKLILFILQNINSRMRYVMNINMISLIPSSSVFITIHYHFLFARFPYIYNYTWSIWCRTLGAPIEYNNPN